jgi:hypothetical protein
LIPCPPALAGIPSVPPLMGGGWSSVTPYVSTFGVRPGVIAPGSSAFRRAGRASGARPALPSPGGGKPWAPSVRDRSRLSMMVCGVGVEPTTFRLRVERSTTERSAGARTRARPVVPRAFDPKNATRVLAFAPAGFARSSALGGLHPPSLDLPVALGFRPSDCRPPRGEPGRHEISAPRPSDVAGARGPPRGASPRPPCAPPFGDTGLACSYWAGTRTSEPPPPPKRRGTLTGVIRGRMGGPGHPGAGLCDPASAGSPRRLLRCATPCRRVAPTGTPTGAFTVNERGDRRPPHPSAMRPTVARR